MQDICDITGFARSTVSLGMRNHPSLPVRTRERIQAVAEQIGYRPNPLVTALMAQLRGRRRRTAETIALVGPFVMSKTAGEIPFYERLHQGIARRAAALGVLVDHFEVGEDKLTGPRLSSILTARGIHGVLLFPGGKLDAHYKGFEWEHFAAVEIGFHGRMSPLHQVMSDYTHDIDIALQVAREAGVKRLGFAVPAGRDRGIDYAWSSRFLVYNQTVPARSVIPFIKSADREFTKDQFFTWLRRYQPDAILVAERREYDWLQRYGTRQEKRLKIINLVQRDDDNQRMSGINPRTEEVGGAAVELLMSLLQSNQIGVPEFPRLISIKGVWLDGDTFTRQAPK